MKDKHMFWEWKDKDGLNLWSDGFWQHVTSPLINRVLQDLCDSINPLNRKVPSQGQQIPGDFNYKIVNRDGSEVVEPEA